MRYSPNPEEKKLLLLYGFSRVGDMSATQITRFLMEYELLEYVDIQLSLGELRDSALIERSRSNTELYAVSGEGKQTLALFEGRLPASQRDCIEQNAARWRKIFQSEQEIRTEVWPDKVGGAVAEMVVSEQDALLFSLRLRAPSAKEARLFCARFRERSGFVYQAVLRELLREDIITNEEN